MIVCIVDWVNSVENPVQLIISAHIDLTYLSRHVASYDDLIPERRDVSTVTDARPDHT